MSSPANKTIYAGKRFVIYNYCHFFKPNNWERIHTATAIKIAVCECKISIVNKKTTYDFTANQNPT